MIGSPSDVYLPICQIKPVQVYHFPLCRVLTDTPGTLLLNFKSALITFIILQRSLRYK